MLLNHPAKSARYKYTSIIIADSFGVAPTPYLEIFLGRPTSRRIGPESARLAQVRLIRDDRPTLGKWA
jgi:hypothetical protein